MSDGAASGRAGVKARVRDLWDGASRSYDGQYSHGLKTGAEREAWLGLLRRVLPESPGRILDVGAGTGFLALLAASLGHEVTAIDLSDEMMAVGREKAEADGLAVTFQQGDAEAPPFGDATFDAVMSRHLTWTLTEPEAAVREWARVTKPGGQVIAIDGVWQARTMEERVRSAAGRTLKMIITRQREHGGMSYPGEAEGYLPLLGMDSPDPLRNAFERAGLRSVRSEYLSRVDMVERAGMPRLERMARSGTRFLVEGTV